MILKRYLKVQGFTQVEVSEIIKSSLPTTVNLLNDPTALRLSQVLSIAKACKEAPQNVIALILGNKTFVVGSKVIIE